MLSIDDRCRSVVSPGNGLSVLPRFPCATTSIREITASSWRMESPRCGSIALRKCIPRSVFSWEHWWMWERAALHPRPYRVFSPRGTEPGQVERLRLKVYFWMRSFTLEETSNSFSCAACSCANPLGDRGARECSNYCVCSRRGFDCRMSCGSVVFGCRYETPNGWI